MKKLAILMMVAVVATAAQAYVLFDEQFHANVQPSSYNDEFAFTVNGALTPAVPVQWLRSEGGRTDWRSGLGSDGVTGGFLRLRSDNDPAGDTDTFGVILDSSMLAGQSDLTFTWDGSLNDKGEGDYGFTGVWQVDDGGNSDGYTLALAQSNGVEPTVTAGSGSVTLLTSIAVTGTDGYESHSLNFTHDGTGDILILFSMVSGPAGDLTDAYSLDNFQLHGLPLFPHDPDVSQAVNGLLVDVDLNWKAAVDATLVNAVEPDIIRQDVYLSDGSGTDPNLYFEGSTGDPGLTDPNSTLAVASLAPITEYEWAVVDIMSTAGDTSSKARFDLVTDANHLIGDVWSFTSIGVDPAITNQPDSAVIPVGEPNVLLTIEADVTHVYQWYRVDKPGDAASLVETDGTPGTPLASASLDVTVEGYYYCVVSNSISTVTEQSDYARVMTPRLVAYYDFEGDLVSAGDAGYDGVYADPNELNPAPTATYVAGLVGQALSLDGDNDGGLHVQITGADPNFFNFYPEGLTVSAWIKTTAGSAESFGQVVTKRINDADEGFALGHFADNARFSFDNDTAAADTGAGETPVNDDQWHMLTSRYSGSLVTLYIDGEQVADTENNWNPATVNVPLLLGAMDTGGAGPYTGLLDEVRIWNYPRTPEEIAWDYNDHRAAAGGEYPCIGDTGLLYDLDGDCWVGLSDFA
ncbi:MAG: LamG-like jellyroll fold domain-containing protein, partial [Planctomycetota bacterium]